MKRILFIAGAVLLLLTTGCLFKKYTFYFNDTINTTIPATASFLPFDLPIPTVTTTIDQELNNEGIDTKLIQEVYLQNLTVTITNPSTDNFSFLDAVYIYIIDENTNKEQEVAYLENIDATSQQIQLKPVDANLVDFIRTGKYKLRIKVKIKKVLNHDVDIRVDLGFKVIVKVL